MSEIKANDIVVTPVEPGVIKITSIKDKTKDPHQCLRDVEDYIDGLEKSLQTSYEINKKLKNGIYEKELIKDLEQQIKELKEKPKHAFTYTEDEYLSIQEWMNKHDKEKHWDEKNNCSASAGAIGGRYIYEFIPTSIGVIGTIKCTCGASFVFTDLDNF